jgi:hypothetical protein
MPVLRTRPELVREDIDLVSKELGSWVAIEKIQALFESTSSPRSRGYCVDLRKVVRAEEQKRQDELIATLAQALPMNPTANAVQLAATSLSGKKAVPFHASKFKIQQLLPILRERHPELWCKKDMRLYLPQLPAAEDLCIEKVVTMLGASYNDSLVFVFRAFLLLAFRHAADFVPFALATRSTSEPELIMMSRMLDLDFSSPGSPRFQRVMRRKVPSEKPGGSAVMQAKIRFTISLTREDGAYLSHFQALLAASPGGTVAIMIRTILAMAMQGRASIVELVDTVRRLRMRDIAAMNKSVMAIPIPSPESKAQSL